MLTSADVLAIRAAAAEGVSHVSLAAYYGVTASNISALVSGKSWSHITAGVIPRRKMVNFQTYVLTVDDVREIRRLVSTGVPQAHVAEAYGVTASNVNHIVHRRAWAHVA